MFRQLLDPQRGIQHDHRFALFGPRSGMERRPRHSRDLRGTCERSARVGLAAIDAAQRGGGPTATFPTWLPVIERRCSSSDSIWIILCIFPLTQAARVVVEVAHPHEVRCGSRIVPDNPAQGRPLQQGMPQSGPAPWVRDHSGQFEIEVAFSNRSMIIEFGSMNMKLKEKL